MGRILIYCQGKPFHVQQNGQTGEYVCPNCGKHRVGVIGWSDSRRTPFHDARPEMQWRELEQERREAEMSRPDFDSPYLDAA